MGQGTLLVTNLLYADDILVSCRATIEFAKVVMELFEKFGGWFGLRVSNEKSSVFFSPKMARCVKGQIKHAIGFQEMKNNTVYLGNSLFFGKRRTKEFEGIKEQVQNCLKGWQSQLLSRVEKVTLIKVVAQAILTYSMATFKLLKQV